MSRHIPDRRRQRDEDEPTAAVSAAQQEPEKKPEKKVRTLGASTVAKCATQHQFLHVAKPYDKDKKYDPKTNPYIPPTEEDYRAMQCKDCGITAWECMEYVSRCPPPGYDKKTKRLTDDSPMAPLKKATYRKRMDAPPITPAQVASRIEAGLYEPGTKLSTTNAVPQVWKTKHIFVDNPESRDSKDPTLKHCKICDCRMSELTANFEICTKPEDADDD